MRATQIYNAMLFWCQNVLMTPNSFCNFVSTILMLRKETSNKIIICRKLFPIATFYTASNSIFLSLALSLPPLFLHSVFIFLFLFGMVAMPFLCRDPFFSRKLSYHRNWSLSVYSPILNFYFFQKTNLLLYKWSRLLSSLFTFFRWFSIEIWNIGNYIHC